MVRQWSPSSCGSLGQTFLRVLYEGLVGERRDQNYGPLACGFGWVSGGRGLYCTPVQAEKNHGMIEKDFIIILFKPPIFVHCSQII